MGHYYACLMCDDCGKINCTCTKTEPQDNDDFIVLNGYSVTTVREAKEQGAGELTLMFKTYYKTRKEAEAVAKKELDEAIKSNKFRLEHLKTLKAKKPWKEAK